MPYVCGINGCKQTCGDIASVQNHRDRCKKRGQVSTGQSASPRAPRYNAAVNAVMNALRRSEGEEVQTA